MSVELHGLKNCDACRKASKALEAAGRAHGFVDVRADGVDAAKIAAWARTVGWRELLNTRSTTWRGLADAEKRDLDEAKAVALMARFPTLLKRPVIEADGRVTVGWTAEVRSILGLT